jgi:prepilin-type N-terminal cleavage/methylation domain-containing protein
MSARTTSVRYRTNRRAQRGARSGFTLIELMVALTAGLFFSVVVFMFMRDASRYFQRETRLADATMSTVVAFERLKADITRAGYLASPLLVKDPKRCPKPPAALATGGWPSFLPLSQMGALYIARGAGGATLGAPGQALLTANGLTPDRIRMYGNYQTAEQFPVEGIGDGLGATVTVQLRAQSGALRRLGYNPAAPDVTLLTNAFPTGRALRVVSPEGEEQYSIILNVVADGVGNPLITLDQANLRLLYKESFAICGIRGGGAGYLVNTVNIIEYNLNDTLVATDPNYQDLRLGNAGEPWARIDLVRSELDPRNGNVIANTSELIAEYAVDLRFGVTAVTNRVTGVMGTFAPGDGGMDPYVTQGAILGSNNGPHYIRGVRAQLSVRTRAPDRDANVPAALLPAGGLYRVMLPPNNDFARVRTLSTTIAIRNTRGARWL